MRLRSRAVFRRHAGQAAFAASIARRVSCAPMCGTLPSFSPVAGLMTSTVAPSRASHHAPSM